jgi:aminoglycoside 6'-N-acetyltransferase I
MNYYIRKLELNDINTLSNIMMKAFKENPWNEEWNVEDCYKRLMVFCNIPNLLSYTLINDINEICGAAIGYFVPLAGKKEYNLQEFFVDPKLKGNHLGTFLMEELLKELKNNKIDIIHFYTSGDLYKFYNKFGFNKVSNEYIMNKSITR